MQNFFQKLVPFILVGIAVVAFAFGIMLLAYLFLFGAIVGFILFIFTWLREKLFPPKLPVSKSPKKGRTFDSDDWKKL